MMSVPIPSKTLDCVMASNNQSQASTNTGNSVANFLRTRSPPPPPPPPTQVVLVVFESSSDSSSDETRHPAGDGKRRCLAGEPHVDGNGKLRSPFRVPLLLDTSVQDDGGDKEMEGERKVENTGNDKTEAANKGDKDKKLSLSGSPGESADSAAREIWEGNGKRLDALYEAFMASEKGSSEKKETTSPSKPPSPYYKDLSLPTLPCDQLMMRFPSPLSHSRYLQFQKRHLIQERYVYLENMSSIVKSALVCNGLLETVLIKEPAAKDVIFEFFANFSPFNSEDKTFNVFIRGRSFQFSPQMINKVLCTNERPSEDAYVLNVDVSMDAVARYLSGNQVKEWRSLTPSMLWPSMRILFRLCCTNWIPTADMTRISPESGRLLYLLGHNHVFNFGRLVYDQVERVACHPSDSDGLPFPSLIHQVLLFQHQIPLVPNEVPDVTTTKFEIGSGSGDVWFS